MTSKTESTYDVYVLDKPVTCGRYVHPVGDVLRPYPIGVDTYVKAGGVLRYGGVDIPPDAYHVEVETVTVTTQTERRLK
jgi:hypothetical protein